MAKKGRSVWPVWLPRPRTWWRTLVLTAVGMGTGLVLFLMEMWRWFIMSAIAQEGFFLFLGFLSLLAALAMYWVAVGLYALVLRIFWSQPPQWLRVGKIGDRFLDLLIIALGILPTTLGLWPYFLESDIMLFQALEAKLGSFDAAFNSLLLTWFPIVVVALHVAALRRQQKPPSVPD